MADARTLQVVFTGETRDLESDVGRLQKVVGGLGTAIGVGAVGAGVALAGLGAAAVKSAADFEAVMSGVKAVSGATADQMKALSGLALQLGKDTSFSASEAAKGIEELVKGGVSVADIMNGAAKSTLALAAAGGVSLPDAAIIAANALAEFNLKGDQMAHVADLIAGAANASALDVGQFKFSLQAAGAVAATVGFTFDDLAVAIAEMGKAGIVGQDAGTSLKTMMLNLQPSTKKATEEMLKLGLITADGANAFFDATGKVKSMAEVAGVLQAATKNLTQQQRLQALETIFGTDAIRAAAVLAKEGAAGFDTMATSMSKVTAASVGAERLNNVRGSIEQLKGSLETAAITLGTTFLPLLRRLIDSTTDLVNAAIPWIERHGPALVASFEDVAAAASGAAQAIAAQVTQSLVDLEPTGQRIARLLDTLGRAFAAVRAVLSSNGSGTGPSFFKVLADEINALSAKWEKLIDDFDKSARTINDFYTRTKPFWDVLARLLPGMNGSPLAGPISGAIGGLIPSLAPPPRVVTIGGGTANVQSAGVATINIQMPSGLMVGTPADVARLLQPELERIVSVRR